MRSRRQVLAAGSAVAGAVLSGCLGEVRSGSGSSDSRTGSGFLLRKAITGFWECNGQEYHGDVLRLWYQQFDSKAVHGSYDPDYAGQALHNQTDVIVSESLHDRLKEKFASVHYMLSICGDGLGQKDTDGCVSGFANRTDFNRVQFQDRAEVSWKWLESGYAGIDVLDVTSGAYRIGKTTIGEFDFDETYPCQ